MLNNRFPIVKPRKIPVAHHHRDLLLTTQIAINDGKDALQLVATLTAKETKNDASKHSCLIRNVFFFFVFIYYIFLIENTPVNISFRDSFSFFVLN